MGGVQGRRAETVDWGRRKQEETGREGGKQ